MTPADSTKDGTATPPVGGRLGAARDGRGQRRRRDEAGADQAGCVQEAVARLCEGFASCNPALGLCEAVDATAMPEPFQKPLHHQEHMTSRLQSYHGWPVELRVRQQRLDGGRYQREIVLVLEGTDRVVEFGILRFDLSKAPAGVREEVLAAEMPLGDILARHNVLRRVEPQRYIRFPRGCALLGQLGAGCGGEFYGRLGRILCEGRPTIEVLEVVTSKKGGL